MDAKQLFADALAHKDKGNVQQAIVLLDQIFIKDPHHIDGLKLAARICYQQGQLKTASNLYQRVLKISPFDVDAWFKYGIVLQKTETDKAIEAFRKVLLYHPRTNQKGKLVAKSFLALALLKKGALGEAEKLTRHVLAKDPNQAKSLNTLAQIEIQKANPQEAHHLFNRLLALRPESAEVHLNLGLASKMMNMPTDATSHIEKAMALRPDWCQPYRELAFLANDSGDSKGGLGLLKKALHLDPKDIENYRAIQGYYIAQGDYKQSIVFGKKLLTIKKDDAITYYQVGLAMSHLGVSDEALTYFKKAFELYPTPESAYGIGTSYQFKKQFDQAIFWFERSLSVDASYLSSLYQLISVRMMLADWKVRDEDERLLKETLRKHMDNGSGHLSIPFLSFSSVELDMDFNLEIHNFLAENISKKVKGFNQSFQFKKRTREQTKIRIGYISPDFRAHPMGRLLRDHFKHHDRQLFEVYGYNLTTADKEDPYHSEIRNGCDYFRDIYFKDTIAAATMIYNDQIDVLIDLGGYTNHARTEILALQPAPIQMTYLGYPNTMGASYIQYILADKWLIPEGMDRYYNEQVIRLPYGIIGSIHEKPGQLEERSQLGIDPDAVVYASFNRIEKITPKIFSIWMDILQSVSHSILWISGERKSVDNLQKVAVERGIGSERIIFSESVPYDQFLNRLSLADVFLDTHYYSAGATAVAAINMGLPLVTCVDQSFTSRISASVLAASNLEELICENLEDYKLKSIRLGNDAVFYQSIKSKLKTPQQLPLFDNLQFTLNLESEIRKIVKKHDSFQGSNLE